MCSRAEKRRRGRGPEWRHMSYWWAQGDEGWDQPKCHGIWNDAKRSAFETEVVGSRHEHGDEVGNTGPKPCKEREGHHQNECDHSCISNFRPWHSADGHWLVYASARKVAI